MRLRIFSLAVLSLVVAAVAPAAAPAKLTVGISDNHPAIFGDPAFKELGAKRVRLVAAWNAVARQQAADGDNESSDKIAPYVTEAANAGVEVMIALEHTRGAPINCGSRSNKKFAQCKLPSVAAYKSAFAAFTAKYPTVKYYTAWNEANHNTQPTQNNPKRAGQYAKAAEQVCKTAASKCKIIAMDILDSANNPKLPIKKLNYSKTAKYVKKLRKAYGKKPSICGIHNYADVNRFRTKGTKAVTKAAKCKSYWLTETGGFYKFGAYWRAENRKNAKKAKAGKCTNSPTCQVAALNYLFKKTVKSARHIDRAYIYNFYSGEDGRFDAGITKGSGANGTVGVKRKSFNIVKKHI